MGMTTAQKQFAALQRAIETSEGRREMAKTFAGFCVAYLPHYFTIPKAPFHALIFRALVDSSLLNLEYIAFRESAKSTIVSLAYVLWSALEKRAGFIIPIADTFTQTKLNMANIKTELEENELIIDDYGEMEGKEEWTGINMLLKNSVRIMGRSRGQKMRGLRHRAQRPDLIIADDIENLDSIRTKEQRDKTFTWFKQDVIPAADKQIGRIVLLGNLMHSDGIMARIEKDPVWLTRKFPLFDKEGNCAWPAAYPTPESVAKQKAKVGSKSWQREYLLKIVPDEGQIIKESWIKYYDIPPDNKEVVNRGTGVDLAISKRETADYTAMVSGKVTRVKEEPRIYIMPNPIYEHLSFHETMERAKTVSMALGGGSLTTLYVEDVAYQKAAIQEMRRAMLSVKSMKPGVDKAARLESISGYVQQGMVVFPRTGCEDLIIQLVGFGSEAHDDLADAFVYLIMGLVKSGMQKMEIVFI